MPRIRITHRVLQTNVSLRTVPHENIPHETLFTAMHHAYASLAQLRLYHRPHLSGQATRLSSQIHFALPNRLSARADLIWHETHCWLLHPCRTQSNMNTEHTGSGWFDWTLLLDCRISAKFHLGYCVPRGTPSNSHEWKFAKAII